MTLREWEIRVSGAVVAILEVAKSGQLTADCHDQLMAVIEAAAVRYPRTDYNVEYAEEYNAVLKMGLFDYWRADGKEADGD